MGHAVVVMPAFLTGNGGEVGPIWLWAVLIFDTPVMAILIVTTTITSLEIHDIHRWFVAPVVLLLGSVYWIALIALAKTVVGELNQSGIDEIDERIRNRRAKLDGR